MYRYTSSNIKRCNEKIAKLSKLHTVPHVDMDAILEGRERRLSIDESLQKGAAFCAEFMKELHS